MELLAGLEEQAHLDFGRLPIQLPPPQEAHRLLEALLALLVHDPFFSGLTEERGLEHLLPAVLAETVLQQVEGALGAVLLPEAQLH